MRLEVLAGVLVSLLLLSALGVHALPDFSITTSLNDNVFYTMPLLPSKTLEYNFTSSFSGVPVVSEVRADIITTGTTTPWRNASFDYRRPITQAASYTGETTTLDLDTSSLISQGRVRPDCADLRLYSNATPIPFILENCSSEDTRLRFKVRDPLEPVI
ncbi:MAG: hypothetical protein ACOC32_02010, partial [Nanoarchaeota archaeon]